MMNIFDMLDKTQKIKLVKTSFPEWYNPMLATISRESFSRDDWIYERKLDGERCIAYGDGNSIRLMSRNRKIISRQYPEICSTLSETGFNFVADGEIVAFDGDVCSFDRLKRRMHVESPSETLLGSIPVQYYLFDILYLDSYDIRRIDQIARKKLLGNAFDFVDPLRYTTHHAGDGANLYHQACKKGWEGLIAKDPHAPYVGKRSNRWLKLKCNNLKEFIICGFTSPKGSRTGFGALLLGYFREGSLQYAGKVGTGFSDKLLEALGDLLESIEIDKSPFEDIRIKDENIHWVEPVLTCKISFTEWTESGSLRHPSFIGLSVRR